MSEPKRLSGHAFMAMTLDGYIARPDNSLDWLMKQNVEGEDHGYETFISQMDCIIMGRHTYEAVLGFGDWPYLLPVIVMSNSLSDADIPEKLQNSVVTSRQKPALLMEALSDLGWSRAYIDGGELIQSFLRENLIADITITTAPILIGQGRRLFGTLPKDINLTLKSSRAFPSGMVQSHYKIG